MLVGCSSDLDRGALSIAKSTMRGKIGRSVTQMGLLLSTFSMAYALAQLPIGAPPGLVVWSGTIGPAVAPPFLTALMLTIG